MPEKATDPKTPKPGTTDFRETTNLDSGTTAPEQMKRDKGFRETSKLDADQFEG